MDTPTQAFLGAALGQALAGRRLGRQAAVWGAVGGLLPDLDILLAAVSPVGDMLYHRGPTHALWFGPVVGSALGWLLWRTRGGRRPGQLAAWITLMVAVLFTHPLLDLFTSYGTQLLAPFSTRRFALDAVAIIDPAYTVWLVAALLIGWLTGWGSRPAKISAWLALTISTGYLFFCWHLNLGVEARVRTALAAEGVRSARVDAYPTLLQAYLRRVVVRNGRELRVGWTNVLNGRPIHWDRFEAPRDPLTDATRATRIGRIFEWFASGQTVGSVEPSGDHVDVVIDDLRYGLPGAPRQGLWGIRARFDRAGHLVGAVKRVRRRPERAIRTYLHEILQGTFN